MSSRCCCRAGKQLESEEKRVNNKRWKDEKTYWCGLSSGSSVNETAACCFPTNLICPYCLLQKLRLSEQLLATGERFFFWNFITSTKPCEDQMVESEWDRKNALKGGEGFHNTYASYSFGWKWTMMTVLAVAARYSHTHTHTHITPNVWLVLLKRFNNQDIYYCSVCPCVRCTSLQLCSVKQSHESLAGTYYSCSSRPWRVELCERTAAFLSFSASSVMSQKS